MKQALRWILLAAACTAVALFADVPHTQTLTIPIDLIDRARIKVELMEELRTSLYEDHEGILNLKREAHIQELARRLR